MANQMTTGLQQFLRAANLFGPQDDTAAYEQMPPELPIGPRQPQLINRQGPSISVPGAYQEDEEGYVPPTIDYGGGNAVLEAFRNSVLNPPKRKQMTYPKNTLAGLDAALRIAAEPSPLEKNRVYVNGQAYQKQQVRTDPVTGEKQFITNIKDPSFGSQVMRAMPAAISPAVDILNQPYQDEIADWEMRNKGMKEAIGAESQMALAGQREAQARIGIPSQATARETTANAAMMNAQTRARLAELNTLTDEDKILLLQKGRISLQEIRDAEAMKRLEKQGEIRSGQIEQQGKIRSGQIAQQGAIRSGQIAQQGDIRSGQIAQEGALAKELAAIRGEEARKTKATPGTGSGSSATQNRVAMQENVTKILNNNPEWKSKGWITFNEQGFPVIATPEDDDGPDEIEYRRMRDAVYPQGKKDVNLPSTGVTQPAPTAPVGTKPLTTTVKPKTTTPTTGKVKVIAPDGTSGTWDLSKGPIPNGFKKAGG